MTLRELSDPRANPVRRIQLELYEKLSNAIAGGRRTDPRELLPGAGDPLEGIVPEKYVPEVETADWFSPTDWAGLGPGSEPITDLSVIPVPGGKGIAGDGLDFFRSGEAPNNYANRHNPLYVARKNFNIAIHERIEDMFNVSAGGSPSYYRQPADSDAEPGGRSPNSDHYSAGAMDFFGSPANLDRLREWLVDQPWVSFVRWRSESHGGASGTEPGAHLHVSTDIGWIAQNYFQSRQLPETIQPTMPRRPSPPRLTTSPVDRPTAGGQEISGGMTRRPSPPRLL